MIDVTSHRYIDECPQKWRKHLVLVDWRLREMSNLSSSIRRYDITEYGECLDYIKAQIEALPDECVHIVKLVHKREFYKLPNIQLETVSDVEAARRKLSKIDLLRYSEIWCCRNPKRNKNSIFGRILIDNSELYPFRCPISIELVWGSSARSIDKYPHMDCPFVAINRNNWNSPCNFTEIIPCGADVDELKIVAMRAIAASSAYTNYIRDFGEYIFSLGCNHLSVEFSYINGELNFIDWDSDNDALVLNTMGANSCGGYAIRSSVPSETDLGKKYAEIKEHFPVSEIITGAGDLCVFAGNGAFVKGYVLLTTNRSCISSYNCSDILLQAVERAVTTIRSEYLKRLNCKTVFFEHGIVYDEKISSASINHFHLHFFPVDRSIWAEIDKKYGFVFYEIESLDRVKNIIDENGIKSYLLFGDSDGKIYLINADNCKYPSQFLRKVIYEYYYSNDDGKWNWRKYPFLKNMHYTKKLFDGMDLN